MHFYDYLWHLNGFSTDLLSSQSLRISTVIFNKLFCPFNRYRCTFSIYKKKNHLVRFINPNDGIRRPTISHCFFFVFVLRSSSERKVPHIFSCYEYNYIIAIPFRENAKTHVLSDDRKHLFLTTELLFSFLCILHASN